MSGNDTLDNIAHLASGGMNHPFVTFTGPPRAKAPGDLSKLTQLGITGGSCCCLKNRTPRSLLVVPVARPADVPARLRWLGACNRFMTGDEISAVLRSWEDRYGAILVEIGATTIGLIAPAVPEDPDDFEALLVEHYIFDYDVVDQIIGSEERHRQLIKAGEWNFWWD